MPKSIQLVMQEAHNIFQGILCWNPDWSSPQENDPQHAIPDGLKTLVGNVVIVSCLLDPQADISDADTVTCRRYVGYVSSTCHQSMSSQMP
jgi:hypothetical protein